MHKTFPSQTNTRPAGAFPVPAAVDLTGKDGYLGTLTTEDDAIVVDLTATAEAADGIIANGVEAGAQETLIPLDPTAEYRVRLKGTCEALDVLVPADSSTAADKGKARALPEAPGTYRQVGVAMEAGVDGQLVLFRPIATRQVVTVSE